MKSIYFGINPYGNGDLDYHAQHPQMDAALCLMGFIADGNSVEFVGSDKRINCPQCIKIIQFCKSFRIQRDYIK